MSCRRLRITAARRGRGEKGEGVEEGGTERERERGESNVYL